MNTPNRFRRALSSPAKERPVLNVVATSSEAVVDILMKDELIAAVPVFSLAFKAMKALDSTRDRLFVAKLTEFVRGADSMNPLARAELGRKLVADEEGRKAAETLLLVLDRVTDMDKPALLGFLVQQFGTGKNRFGRAAPVGIGCGHRLPRRFAGFAGRAGRGDRDRKQVTAPRGSSSLWSHANALGRQGGLLGYGLVAGNSSWRAAARSG